ncbi:MAG: hypothetical protein ABF792_00680 [Bifidobacterium psychraerophilum]
MKEPRSDAAGVPGRSATAGVATAFETIGTAVGTIWVVREEGGRASA